MSSVIDALSWVLLVTGGVFCVIGAVGLIRMPDFFTRMHAASVIETLGAGPILLGLMLQAGFTLNTLKLLVLGLLLFFASPTATHALARAAMARGLQPELAPDPPSGPDPEPVPGPAQGTATSGQAVPATPATAAAHGEKA